MDQYLEKSGALDMTVLRFPCINPLVILEKCHFGFQRHENEVSILKQICKYQTMMLEV